MNLLKFEKLITPAIIQIFYFVGLIAVVIAGIWTIMQGSLIQGILIIIFGAIAVRVQSELLILFFRVYDKLCEINNNLKTRA
jgi:hypothetical protein